MKDLGNRNKYLEKKLTDNRIIYDHQDLVLYSDEINGENVSLGL